MDCGSKILHPLSRTNARTANGQRSPLTFRHVSRLCPIAVIIHLAFSGKLVLRGFSMDRISRWALAPVFGQATAANALRLKNPAVSLELDETGRSLWGKYQIEMVTANPIRRD